MNFHDLMSACIGLPKSIIYNFCIFPFKQAIRFPLLVSHSTLIKGINKNCIEIKGKPAFGQLKIGFFRGIGGINSRSSIIRFNGGKFIVDGKISIGKGCSLFISGNLVLHSGFQCGANLILVCRNKIEIGKDALISWNCSIMDSDGHDIYLNDSIVNNSKPILFGRHCWLGAGVTVLKGTRIPDNVVVSINTTLHGTYTEPNIIIREDKEMNCGFKIEKWSK